LLEVGKAFALINAKQHDALSGYVVAVSGLTCRQGVKGYGAN
jgi:hypothetical protein